jgi:hypothetical protein
MTHAKKSDDQQTIVETGEEAWDYVCDILGLILFIIVHKAIGWCVWEKKEGLEHVGERGGGIWIFWIFTWDKGEHTSVLHSHRPREKKEGLEHVGERGGGICIFCIFYLGIRRAVGGNLAKIDSLRPTYAILYTFHVGNMRKRHGTIQIEADAAGTKNPHRHERSKWVKGDNLPQPWKKDKCIFKGGRETVVVPS